MIPQMATIKGSNGDCFRACIASILEVPIEQVPHFFNNNVSAEEGIRATREWLKSMGYGYEEFAMDGTSPFSELKEFCNAHLSADQYFVLIGTSIRGFNHAVILKDGEIVHDPSADPGHTVLVGPARMLSGGRNWFLGMVTYLGGRRKEARH